MEKLGQVDSKKSPEPPEITEMTQNFSKVTKYLTKLKETLTSYVEKILMSKNVKNKIFREFRVFQYALW